jgi:hypothetical protein
MRPSYEELRDTLMELYLKHGERGFCHTSMSADIWIGLRTKKLLIWASDGIHVLLCLTPKALELIRGETASGL